MKIIGISKVKELPMGVNFLIRREFYTPAPSSVDEFDATILVEIWNNRHLKEIIKRSDEYFSYNPITATTVSEILENVPMTLFNGTIYVLTEEPEKLWMSDAEARATDNNDWSVYD